MKTKSAILDYQLTDVLEMNYSKNPAALKAIKQTLLAGPIKDFNVHSLSSFILENTLVIIHSGDLSRVKRVYFLDSTAETFKTYCIHSIQRERGFSYGRKLNQPFNCERLAPA